MWVVEVEMREKGGKYGPATKLLQLALCKEIRTYSVLGALQKY